jgi:hypothetical protein
MKIKVFNKKNISFNLNYQPHEVVLKQDQIELITRIYGG